VSQTSLHILMYILMLGESHRTMFEKSGSRTQIMRSWSICVNQYANCSYNWLEYVDYDANCFALTLTEQQTALLSQLGHFCLGSLHEPKECEKFYYQDELKSTSCKRCEVGFNCEHGGKNLCPFHRFCGYGHIIRRGKISFTQNIFNFLELFMNKFFTKQTE
jgi:hypothetical protein